MTTDSAMQLNPGDTVLALREVFRVTGYPEKVKWQRRNTVRIPVLDGYGRTQVLLREDIVRCLRKAA